MAKKRGKLGVWLAMAASVVGVGAYVWLRMSYLHREGKNIFWLAELFPPVAIFSILAVMFVEKLVSPGTKAPARKKAYRKAS